MVHHINGEDRTVENPWKLQYYCKKGKSAYTIDLINDKMIEDNLIDAKAKSKQRELVHLLSMFEVAFTAKQRKNYLFYCLLHLFEDWDVEHYLKFVRKKDSKVRNDFFADLGCNDFGLDTFDDFYFSRTRKSLEHYYPQAKAGENMPITAEEINCFGNFVFLAAKIQKRRNLHAKIVIKTLKVMKNISKSFAYLFF